MKCPICVVNINESWRGICREMPVEDHTYRILRMNCPQCKNDLLRLIKHGDNNSIKYRNGEYINSEKIIYGDDDNRVERECPILLTKKLESLSKFIPEEYIKLYEESYSIRDLSPKVSAALSRACIQLLLREYGKIKHGSLSDEIQQVIDSKDFPSRLKESMDIIRKNGNNAVHPNKSDNPREIISVDHDEVELGLEILDSLFDHYIIGPKKLKERLDKRNKEHPKNQDLKKLG